MKDVFYTLLIVWLVWRVMNSVSNYNAKKNNPTHHFSGEKEKEPGSVTINTQSNSRKKTNDDDGDYVDFEEVK